MTTKLNTAAIALVLLLASAAEISEGGGSGGATFDVMKHGAKADGKTDNTKVREAWKIKLSMHVLIFPELDLNY